MEKDECQEHQRRQEDVKRQPQKQRQSCETFTTSHWATEEKRRIYGNDGDYAHAPADGQTVKERLNKSENNQAAILMYAFKGLCSTARGRRKSEPQQRRRKHTWNAPTSRPASL